MGQEILDKTEDTEETAENWRPDLATAPLYLQVARHLDARILNGSYAIGSLLPTENELAVELGVSRQTVRQAIATLRAQGRLSARKGVGTRVEAGADDFRKRFFGQTRTELFEFASQTEFVITGREELAARGRLAVDLGCRPGRRFVRLEGLRYSASRLKAFSWNEVYIDARLGPAVKDVDTVRTAIFHLIEEHTGEKIKEILQEIKPAMIDEQMANRLDAKAGDLALQVTRRYFGSGRRLLEYAIQTLPADRFTYTTTLKAEDSE